MTEPSGYVIEPLRDGADFTEPLLLPNPGLNAICGPDRESDFRRAKYGSQPVATVRVASASLCQALRVKSSEPEKHGKKSLDDRADEMR
jgi:hypothetical protein